MYIKGLQKLTLLDYPDKMACTVFTAGCNFKCPFCHNASLVFNRDDNRISEQKFFDFLSKRVGVIDGVCITGGEPTLQTDIVQFIKKIKELGFLVKLDTNGYRPDMLKFLVDNKLIDYVAMDIKNCKEKYPLTSGVENIEVSFIEQSVEYLLADNVDYEFRTTVVKEYHTLDDMIKIGEWIKGAKKYYLQAFVDSGDLICDGLSSYDKNDIQNLLNMIKPRIPSTKIRGF